MLLCVSTYGLPLKKPTISSHLPSSNTAELKEGRRTREPSNMLHTQHPSIHRGTKGEEEGGAGYLLQVVKAEMPHIVMLTELKFSTHNAFFATAGDVYYILSTPSHPLTFWSHFKYLWHLNIDSHWIDNNKSPHGELCLLRKALSVSSCARP